MASIYIESRGCGGTEHWTSLNFLLRQQIKGRREEQAQVEEEKIKTLEHRMELLAGQRGELVR